MLPVASSEDNLTGSKLTGDVPILPFADVVVDSNDKVM